MAQNFPREGVEAEIRKRVVAAWTHYAASPQVGAVVGDVWPQESALIWDCGRLRADGYKVYKSKTAANKFRVAPFRCGRIPFCIPCTRADVQQRAREALDGFQLFTPKEQPMRLWHVVLTAPLTLDGQGWGSKACRDIPRFALVCRRFLQEVWGPGVGGVMSYQDFGETPFRKHHPHFDVIVNGYVLRDGMPVLLPRLDFAGSGGRRRLDDLYRGVSQTLVDMTARAGDLDFRAVGDSGMSRRRVVGYSVREMVDLRKSVYEGDGRVGWRDYEEDTVDWTDRRGFCLWFDEYQSRVNNGQRLHRWFGAMSTRDVRNPVVRAFGGSDPHPGDCGCNQCDDWERLPADWDRPEAGLHTAK